MNRRLALLLTVLLAPVAAQPAFALRHHHAHKTPGFDLKRPEIVSFVNDVVGRDQLKRKAVLALLAKAEPQPRIVELMTRPAEKVTPWWQYHDQFLTPERIELGVQLTNHINIRVGYNLLWWSSVLRPGSVVSPAVTRSQVPIDPTYSPTPVANALPMTAFHSSDFLAHGLTVGAVFGW